MMTLGTGIGTAALIPASPCEARTSTQRVSVFAGVMALQSS